MTSTTTPRESPVSVSCGSNTLQLACPYDGQIFVFDDADDSITLLEDGYDDAHGPHIAGDFVVWHVWDGHDMEIMMAVACDKLPGDVNDDCIVDLADFAALAAETWASPSPWQNRLAFRTRIG